MSVKVVYVSNANIPSESASSVHVMKMCEAFRQNGADITLLIPNHYNKETYKDTDTYQFYGVSDRFPIKRIRFIQKNVKGIREILYSACAVLYTKYIRRPDFMMTRKIMAARIAAMVHLPYVLELHTATEPTHYSLEKTLQSKYMKRLVVISEALKRHIIEKYHVDEKRIAVLSDAVDLSAYEKLNTKLSPNAEQLRIGYVGSLYPGKGIETIIRLAAADRENRYDIYGARGPLDKWKELKKELDSPVNFMGQIDNARVPETLLNYDVLLMPYSNKVEVYGEDLTNYMSPLKMFEYMASGRVIVSSDLPVIREILRDGENAYLVPAEQPDEWHKKITQIRQNPAQAVRIAEQAKQDVKRYTWKNRAAQLLEMVREQ